MRKHYLPAIEQKEAAKHGESFFPIQKYITTLSEKCQIITTHWHEEAEITMLTKGNCTYQIDLVEYKVKEGDIVIIPPFLLHSVSIEDSEEMTSETYVFHLNFLGGNSTDICSTRYLTPMMNREFSIPHIITPEFSIHDSLKAIFFQIHDLYDSAVPGYELAVKSMLLQVCFLMIQYSKRIDTPGPGNQSDMLKSVLDYIELNYAEEITVSTLASICNFSDYHFMRFFKKCMNMTCVEYINNLRLEKAVELFEMGNTSIMDVSLSVGFHNLSYFHRVFRRKYHVTPLSLIRELQRKVTAPDFQ